jgi:hypothetical protein
MKATIRRKPGTDIVDRLSAWLDENATAPKTAPIAWNDVNMAYNEIVRMRKAIADAEASRAAR